MAGTRSDTGFLLELSSYMDRNNAIAAHEGCARENRRCPSSATEGVGETLRVLPASRRAAALPSLGSLSVAHSSRIAAAVQSRAPCRGRPKGNRRCVRRRGEEGVESRAGRSRGEKKTERSRMRLRFAMLTSPFTGLLSRLGGRQRSAMGTREACELSRAGLDPTPPAGAGPSGDVGIVWFRNDLRVHDNEALSEAMKRCSSILPVFCFDSREFGRGAKGGSGAGPYKARFTQEAVRALRNKLRSLGSDLFIRVGCPEDVIPDLCREVRATVVFCQGEVSKRDQDVEARVVRGLKTKTGGAAGGRDRTLERCWGSTTLHHIRDVPFDLQAMPTNYAAFCKNLESTEIKPAFDSPKKLKEIPARGRRIKRGKIPTLEDLNLETLNRSQRKIFIKTKDGRRAQGGEERALSQLKRHCRGAGSRGGGEGGAMTTAAAMTALPDHLAPWFSLGCVSAKRVYHEILRHVGKHHSRQSTTIANVGLSGHEKDFVFELLWRDFFRFSRMKMSQSIRV